MTHDKQEQRFREDIAEATSALRKFRGPDLTLTIAKIEESLRGLTAGQCVTAITTAGANSEVLGAAGLMKRAAAQIDVVIHALGILLCLPHLLEPTEIIEYVSLGAGNTGRAFDLETTFRIAEFKFISWQGGPESIRQNTLFKDFYLLAEKESPKRKYLYVLGTDYPKKFLTGGRALSSLLSRDNRLKQLFEGKYASKFARVRDYYSMRKDDVIIEDVSQYLAGLFFPA